MSELRAAYKVRHDEMLVPLASAIERQLKDLLSSEPRVDRVVARAKSIDRFLVEAESQKDGARKYEEPLRQIQDQVGARIITFYQSDIERVKALISRYYRAIEYRDVVPESEWEFGYFGWHTILFVPTDLLALGSQPPL